MRIDSIRPFDSPLEHQTLSDQILNNLVRLSAKEKDEKKVFVENKNTPIETYHYGNESAKIIKRLHDATVGEEGGEVRYYVEWVDYRHFQWWKNALEKLPIYFLNIPVDYFASEAGFPHPELLFSPEKVTEHYLWNPQNADRRIACKQWVEDQVVKILNPSLSPDYRVQFLEGYFRLIPLTPEAIESHLIDNGAYNKAKSVIGNAIKPLQETYERMNKKLKGN